MDGFNLAVFPLHLIVQTPEGPRCGCGWADCPRVGKHPDYSTKPCRKCGAVDRYPWRGKGTDGDCRPCNRSREKERRRLRAAGVQAQRKEYRAANADVIRERKKAYRLANLDKVNARGKRYVQQNRERLRAWHRMYKTGWTQSSFDSAWEAQAGCCAICRQGLTQGRGATAVNADHCHKTGRQRALLCANCNRGLGYFADDTDRLRAAALYLEAHS